MRTVGAERVDTEPEATAELARRCAYLPLALRIAAERVAARAYLTIAELVDELAFEYERLNILSADDDENTAVRTVFSWSYLALSPETARMFRLLGVHPGPNISVPAAAALTNTDTDTARRQLGALASVHLIAEIARDRYQFHDLLRAYATECASTYEPPHERDEAVRRILTWYLHTAHTAHQFVYPPRPVLSFAPPAESPLPLAFADREQALRWYDDEHASLLAAIRCAADTSQLTIAWQLPQAMDIFLWLRHHVVDRVAVSQIGLAAAQQLQDQTAQAWTQTSAGYAVWHARRYDDAVVHHQHALAISQVIKYRWMEATAHCDLGYCYHELEQFENASEHLRQALSIAREIRDQRIVAVAQAILGATFGQVQHFEQAVAHLQQGLSHFRASNDQEWEAYALRHLGLTYLSQELPAVAIDHFQQSVTVSQDQDNQYTAAEALNDLGNAFRSAGRLAEARQSWLSALAIFDELATSDAAQVRARLATLDADNPDRSDEPIAAHRPPDLPPPTVCKRSD